MSNVSEVDPPAVSSGTREDELPEVALEESLEPETLPEVVDSGGLGGFPGAEVYTRSWNYENNDGYTFAESITIWQPTRSTESFVHPKEAAYVIDGMGEDLGVIPFWARFQNTTDGFGPAGYEYAVAQSSTENWTGPFTLPGDNGGNVLSPELLEENGSFYFVTEVWTGSEGYRAPKAFQLLHTDGGEVDEGKSVSSYGWFVFMDERSTPNLPNGATAEMLDDPSGGRPCTVFSGLVSDAALCRAVVTITKDVEGNDVIGDKFGW